MCACMCVRMCVCGCVCVGVGVGVGVCVLCICAAMSSLLWPFCHIRMNDSCHVIIIIHVVQHTVQHTLQHTLQYTLQHALQHKLQHKVQWMSWRTSDRMLCSSELQTACVCIRLSILLSKLCACVHIRWSIVHQSSDVDPQGEIYFHMYTYILG